MKGASLSPFPLKVIFVSPVSAGVLDAVGVEVIVGVSEGVFEVVVVGVGVWVGVGVCVEVGGGVGVRVGVGANPPGITKTGVLRLAVVPSPSCPY